MSKLRRQFLQSFLPSKKTSTLFTFLHPDRCLLTVVSWSLLNSSGTKSNHFQRFPSSLLGTKIHFYMIASNKNVAINFVFCTISLLTNKKNCFGLIWSKKSGGHWKCHQTRLCQNSSLWFAQILFNSEAILPGEVEFSHIITSHCRCV